MVHLRKLFQNFDIYNFCNYKVFDGYVAVKFFFHFTKTTSFCSLVLDCNANKVAIRLRDNGLLSKPTQEHTLRFAPPLTMTEEQLRECVDIIVDAVNYYA